MRTNDQAPSPVAQPPNRRGRRRRGAVLLLRAMGALAAVGLAAAGVMFFGWRYGFSPLPEVVPGVQFPSGVRLEAWNLGSSNYWYWARELERKQPGDNRSVLAFLDVLQNWAEFGSVAVTNRDSVQAWLSTVPFLPECLAGALAAPADPYGSLPPGLESQLAMPNRLLSGYTLWLAAESERAGQSLAAFDHLLAGWRLSARSLLYARFNAPPVEQLTKVWRRVALAGAPISAAETQRLLAELAATERWLPSLESLFDRDTARNRALVERELVHFHPDWGDVSRSFRQGLQEMGRDVGRGLSSTLGRFLGEKAEETWQAEGISYLLFPLRYLVTTAQQSAARPEDFRRMRDAYFSQVLSRIRAGHLEAAEQYAAAVRAAWLERGWLRRFLDRPSVWESAMHYLTPMHSQEQLNLWRRSLESCRLALALRLYRERHGAWPNRWEDLVPGVLASVPLDPCTGKSFGYEHQEESWRVWPGDIPMASNGVAVPPPGRRPLFSSRDVQEAQKQWEAQQAEWAALGSTMQSPTMTKGRMLQRAGYTLRWRPGVLPANPASPPLPALRGTNSAGAAPR